MIKTRIKFPLDLAAREDFAAENKHITVRWGTSRGRETYGYTTCTLTVEGRGRRASCSGGGYSLIGACLGGWLQRDFAEQLQALDLGRLTKAGISLYGLSFWDPVRRRDLTKWREGATLYVHGSCGEQPMESILRALGYDLTPCGPTIRDIRRYYLEARKEKYISRGY